MTRDLLPQGNLGRLSDRDATVQQSQEDYYAQISGFDAFATGIRRENYFSAWVNDKITKSIMGIDQEQYAPDPNYLFEEDEANFGYDPMVMVDARSAEEAAAFRAQIDREMNELKMISANAGGVAGQMFGGFSNPHVLGALPFMPVAGGWGGVAAIMATEGALEAGSEVLLHNMQKTRTLQESLFNVGVTTAGVGILGGASVMLGRMRAIPPDVTEDINAGLFPGGGDGSLSAAKTVERDAVTAEDDRLIGGRAADFLSFGQMAALSKSPFETARMIAGKLADNPLFNRGHAKGKTRGVSVEALHEAAMGRVVIATDKAARLRKQSGLTHSEFEHEVGVAMSQGDRHANAQVQQAAEMYRADVVGPIQEAAARLGLLETDEGLKVKIGLLEDDIQRLIDEGGGPGTTARTRELEAEKAKVISAAQKQTDKLTKRVATLEAALAIARRPLKEGGKARKAPASMMKEYNAARKALTKHQKGIESKTADATAQLRWIKAQNKRLAHTRKQLKKLKAKQDQGGRIYAESYFPRIYDSNKIYDNWSQLQRMLDNHFKQDKKLANLEPGERLELVLDTMQNMLGGRSQLQWGSGKKAGKPSALRARSLALLDKNLEPFLEKRASQVMLKHAQGLQPYIMMREAFDGQSLEDMIELLKGEHKVMIAKTDDPVELKKLDKELDDNIERIQIMADRLMHQVQRAVQPRNAFVRAIQYSKLWNLATLLGGVVLSSLPDIARPIAHYGMRSFAKGTAKALSQAFSGKQSLSSIQVKRTGAAIQRTLNDRAMQLTDSLEPDSKWLLRGQKIWSKASGFDYYTDIMESIAAHTAMDYVVRQAAKVASAQPLSKGATKQLARMGLDEEDLIGIYHESMGTMGAQDSVLKYMNTMQWKDVDLAKRTEAAIGADVRRTIIRIGVGEKPAIMDDHMVSWLLQFQSFAMSAQNKIMIAGMQNMNRHTAEGLIAMMFLGASVGAAKTWLRGGDMEAYFDPENLLAEGIDRSGMIGALREPFNALRFLAATQGWTDAVPSRYAGKGVERAITPPAASVVSYAAQSGYAAMEGDFETAGEKIQRALPFVNNLWHIRETLNQLGDM